MQNQKISIFQITDLVVLGGYHAWKNLEFMNAELVGRPSELPGRTFSKL